MRARRPSLAAGATAVAVVAAAAGGAGCGSKKRQKRSGDSPAVELVTAPSLGSGSGSGSGKLAEVEEREPNDGADVATALAPGGSVRGTIEPDADVDYFRIDVAQGGGLSVIVSAVAGADLTLDIEDASGTVIARSDRGAANVSEGVPNLGVTPGRYTAVVRKKAAPAKKPVRGKKGAPPAPEPPAGPVAYVIAAQVSPFGKSAEREPDDDRGTANDLIIGETVTGFVGWTGDADVWKLSVEAVSAKNVLDLELGAIEGAALTVEVADGIGQPILVRKAPRGAPITIHNLAPVIPQGAPPFHYVTVKADRSSPEAGYQLKITGRVPGADAETEPNDTPDKPMAIPADRTVVREAFWSPGDVDCFAVAPDPAARTVEVTVDPPAEADLRLELFVNGRSVATSERGKGKGDKGKDKDKAVSGQVPADGRAVACVRGTDASKEGTYDLAVHEGPAKEP